MMKELIEAVEKLVAEEYVRAKEKFGAKHASQQEAYAVIKEELQETIEQINSGAEAIEVNYWENVRNDNELGNVDVAKIVYKNMVLAACEAIQTAAMCYKATLGFERSTKK